MSEQTKEGAGGVRILVVDDEPVVHDSLRRVLSRRGYRVDAVLSARDGLELLRGARFDLVITDLMMPEMNGIELLQALRREARRVPVIMLTGYPTIRTAVQAMRLGASDYLSKPFTRTELLGPVLRALRTEGPDPGADAEPDAAPGSTSLLPGDTARLPRHSWARFGQDGLFLVGVEPSFLAAVGEIVRVSAPAVDDLVEQGAVGLRLFNRAGEEHGVVMPLSGQVVAVDAEAVAAPQRLTAGVGLLQVLASHLEEELPHLVLARASAQG